MEPFVADQSPPFQGRRPSAFGVSERGEFVLFPRARDVAKRTAFSCVRTGLPCRHMADVATGQGNSAAPALMV
jgi:hypothetical protein